MTDQKERLKKLYALAMRGVGGEKETAQAILDKLLKKQVKATERELAAFVAVGKRLLNARANKRVIAPVFEELQQLINTYENF